VPGEILALIIIPPDRREPMQSVKRAVRPIDLGVYKAKQALDVATMKIRACEMAIIEAAAACDSVRILAMHKYMIEGFTEGAAAAQIVVDYLEGGI